VVTAVSAHAVERNNHGNIWLASIAAMLVEAAILRAARYEKIRGDAKFIM
jgi:alkylation response protein AidB-like acyl-CoA dehydrogenase